MAANRPAGARMKPLQRFWRWVYSLYCPEMDLTLFELVRQIRDLENLEANAGGFRYIDRKLYSLYNERTRRAKERMDK